MRYKLIILIIAVIMTIPFWNVYAEGEKHRYRIGA